MKVVLDTNTWLSAIVWRGEATKIIEAGLNKKIQMSSFLGPELTGAILDKYLTTEIQELYSSIKALFF